MTEHNRWPGLVCALCGQAMPYTPPLVAWEPDHAEGADLALAAMVNAPRGRAEVWAVVVHPECVGEQE